MLTLNKRRRDSASKQRVLNTVSVKQHVPCATIYGHGCRVKVHDTRDTLHVLRVTKQEVIV
jgi:hypothetical protein